MVSRLFDTQHNPVACPCKQQSKIVSQESIKHCYIETHFIENTKRLNDDVIKLIKPVSDEVNLDSNEVEQLLMKLRYRINKDSMFGQFKDPYLSSNQIFIRTCGVSKSQFIKLHGCLSSINNTASRSKRQALSVYLFWLKTGCTQDIIPSYFGAYLSQIDISRYCDQVRVA